MPLNHDKSRAYRAPSNGKVDLDKIDPKDTSHLGSADEARAYVAETVESINALQDRLYAEGQRSLLVILQGMDTSGKDGTVRDVFNATGPLGVTVQPFRQPSADELSRDFLWRVHQVTPRKGTIAIFNRSHYEDVLVAKVRKFVPHDEIEQRYDQINAFEKMLIENGTVILKFMLHISKAEQGKRLQERLDDPDKHWKFQPADLEDRKAWKDFQAAYETMLERCSPDIAPWHIIPSDHKWARNAAIAGIVHDTLKKMDPQYPTTHWKPDDFMID